MHLKHPDPAILQALATFNAAIVPKKLLLNTPGATLDDKSKAFAEHPIGSGPFVLKSWTHNSEMVLVRNPYYWDKAADGKPLPYLDELRFPIIPDDATRVLKLKAGEIDATEFVPLSRVQELKADPKLNMILFPSEKIIYLNLDNRPMLANGQQEPDGRRARAPGAEPRHRQGGAGAGAHLRGRHAAKERDADVDALVLVRRRALPLRLPTRPSSC